MEIRLQLNAWDCFLYSGVLYVISTDNVIRAFDWSKVLDSVATDRAHAALYCAFSRADYPKSGEWSTAMTKDQFYEALRTSVRHAAKRTFEVDQETLMKCELFAIDNPLGSITSAFTVYKNSMYISSRKGLFSQKLPRSKEKPRVRDRAQLWEGRAVSLVGGGISS